MYNKIVILLRIEFVTDSILSLLAGTLILGFYLKHIKQTDRALYLVLTASRNQDASIEDAFNGKMYQNAYMKSLRSVCKHGQNILSNNNCKNTNRANNI